MNTETNENEMRQVFDNALSAIASLRDKTISTVVQHSDTARQLEALNGRFNELSERMNSVVQEAQRFRTDLHLTLTERDKYKKDAEDNLALANSYEQERNEARDNVNHLNDSNASLTSQLGEAHRKLEAANSSIARLGGDLDWLRKVNTDLRSNNDGLTTDLANAQTEARNAQVRLDKLQGIMKELFPETTKVEPQPLHDYQTTAIENVASNPQPHPLQSVGEAEVSGVNERIDQPNDYDKPIEEAKPLPWWEKEGSKLP